MGALDIINKLKNGQNKLKFTNEILIWWKYHRRNFPWRETKKPYVILITEILLRRTSAEQVNKVHGKFFSKYSSISELANADKTQLKEIIKSLGLANQRSIQLINLANIILKDYNNEIPSNIVDLMNLPGVGKYTASGVMCISFKEDHAMVDTNVVKIIKRFFGFEPKKIPPQNDKDLWYFVETLIPKGKCIEFNLGLIDFVYEICKMNPKCEICPLKKDCNYYSNLENKID